MSKRSTIVRYWIKRHWVVLALGPTFAVTLGIVIVYQTTALPPLNFYTTSQTSILTYSNGNELGRVFREDRSEISITEVPKVFQSAILAAEDSNFYSHIGFDLFAITRALMKNTTTDKIQGGSTITQQYIKIAYLSPDQNISRKIKEIFFKNRDPRKIYKCTLFREKCIWG